MQVQKEFTKRLKFNDNIAKRLLSTDLYDRPEDSFRELVSNAYDSKSDKVEIRVLKNKYEIEDFGTGIKNIDQYLDIGSDEKSSMSMYGGRKTIGNKGIGKLSVFSLARKMEVISNYGKKTAVMKLREHEMNVVGLEIENPNDLISHRGTKIILSDIKSKLDPDKLRTYLSKTFTPLISAGDFQIFFNDDQLTSVKWPNGEKYKINVKAGKRSKVSGELIVPSEISDRRNVTLYHNGVKVSDDFVIPRYGNLTGWLDEDFLTIKTDRNGYVKDSRYNGLKELLQKEATRLGIRSEVNMEKLDKTLRRVLFNVEQSFRKIGVNPVKIERLMGKKIRDIERESRIKGRRAERAPIPGGSAAPYKKPPKSERKAHNFRKVLRYPVSGFEINLVESSPEKDPVFIDEPNRIYINLSNPMTEYVMNSPPNYKSVGLGILVMQGMNYLLTKDGRAKTYFDNLNQVQTEFFKTSTIKNKRI